MNAAVQLGKSVVYGSFELGKSIVISRWTPTLIVGYLVLSAVNECTRRIFNSLTPEQTSVLKVRPKLIVLAVGAVLVGSAAASYLTGIPGIVSVLALALWGFLGGALLDSPVGLLSKACEDAYYLHLYGPHTKTNYEASLKVIDEVIKIYPRGDEKEQPLGLVPNRSLARLWVQRTLSFIMPEFIHLSQIEGNEEDEKLEKALKLYPNIDNLVKNGQEKLSIIRVTTVGL